MSLPDFEVIEIMSWCNLQGSSSKPHKTKTPAEPKQNSWKPHKLKISKNTNAWDQSELIGNCAGTALCPWLAIHISIRNDGDASPFGGMRTWKTMKEAWLPWKEATYLSKSLQIVDFHRQSPDQWVPSPGWVPEHLCRWGARNEGPISWSPKSASNKKSSTLSVEHWIIGLATLWTSLAQAWMINGPHWLLEKWKSTTYPFKALGLSLLRMHTDRRVTQDGLRSSRGNGNELLQQKCKTTWLLDCCTFRPFCVWFLKSLRKMLCWFWVLFLTIRVSYNIPQDTTGDFYWAVAFKAKLFTWNSTNALAHLRTLPGQAKSESKLSWTHLVSPASRSLTAVCSTGLQFTMRWPRKIAPILSSWASGKTSLDFSRHIISRRWL